jgi:hypothetical protein
MRPFDAVTIMECEWRPKRGAVDATGIVRA